MKFDREELLSVLSDAAPALAKSEAIPGLDHFWFDGKFVYAYNGGLGVRTVLKSDLNCGLPGKTLLNLLRTSALKEVDLGEAKKGVALKMGKSTVNLVSLEGDRNPWNFSTPSKKDTRTLTLSEAVLEALTRVSFVRRSSKPTRVVAYGITVIPQDKTVEFYSTDEVSMARAVLDLKTDKSLDKFIAPWEFVDRVLALSAPGAVLHVLDDCLLVDSNGVLVASNILEPEDEPDLQATVENLDVEETTSEIPGDLPLLLDRAAILAGNMDEAVVTLSTEDKSLILEGRYPLGTLDEEMELKSKVSDASARFSAMLIRRGLATATAMSLTSKVLILRDGEDFIYLVSAKPAKKSAKETNKKEKETEKPKSTVVRRRRAVEEDEIPF